MTDEASTDLIPVDYKPLATMFSTADDMEKVLTRVKKRARSEAADVETEEGRASIKSLAYKVSRSRSAIDQMGKPLADVARQDYDRINALRKKAQDELADLRDEVREPLNKWEKIEKDRIAAIEDRFLFIKAMLKYDRTVNPEVLEQRLADLKKINPSDESWGERGEDVAQAVVASLDHLKRELAEAKRIEAERVELAELRALKIKAEADAAEAEHEKQMQEREAGAAASAKRAAETAAEDALEREKDRAAREVTAAEDRATAAEQQAAGAAHAEGLRIQAGIDAALAQKAERKADKDHRDKREAHIERQLTGAPVRLSTGDARKVVAAVSDKLISYFRIDY